MEQINNILYGQIRVQFWKYAIIILLMAIAIGLEAVLPFTYKLLIDNVLGGQPIETHAFPFVNTLLSYFATPKELGVFVLIIFFCSNILIDVVDYIRLIITRVTVQNGIYEFSRQAFRNFESYNIGSFRKIDIGDYIYRLAYDVDALGDILESGFLPIIGSSLYLIITTVVMFFISVKLTLISFITIPFLVVTLMIFNNKVQRASQRSEITNSLVFSFMQQALTQLKVIQAYSQEQTMSNEYNLRERASLKAALDLNKVNFLYDLMIGLAITITYTTVFGYGINAVFSGEISTGLLIVFIFYLDNLTNPLVSIADSLYGIQEARVRIARLADFFDEKTHLDDNGDIAEIRERSIAYENVTLIGEEDFVILDNVSCEIPANKITIVAGISGSGKTSFISLIPRLIGKPTEGRVLIGNVDINQYSVNTLRDNISLVAQESALFNHTIRNIIAFGKPDATYEEIHQAAKFACAEDFIMEHPQGYNFKVGEGGNYLSGGQRQRLMIARAFLKNSDILIMDEPFSNLDEETKKKVWKNIRTHAKGKTVIIVSNILDIIDESDYLIILNSGKLKYQGEYKQVKGKNNLADLLLEGF